MTLTPISWRFPRVFGAPCGLETTFCSQTTFGQVGEGKSGWKESHPISRTKFKKITLSVTVRGSLWLCSALSLIINGFGINFSLHLPCKLKSCPEVEKIEIQWPLTFRLLAGDETHCTAEWKSLQMFPKWSPDLLLMSCSILRFWLRNISPEDLGQGPYLWVVKIFHLFKFCTQCAQLLHLNMPLINKTLPCKHH